MKLLILNGPNINLLGRREPEIYGHNTYAELEDYIRTACSAYGAECEIFQSNHEGDLIDRIQAADGFDGIVLNAGGYTHTSVAIPDAVRGMGIPTVEVHLSDPTLREPYRHVSYLSDCVIATVRGKGFAGYGEAIRLLVERKAEEQ